VTAWSRTWPAGNEPLVSIPGQFEMLLAVTPQNQVPGSIETPLGLVELPFSTPSIGTARAASHSAAAANASDLPIVRPGTRAWNEAVAALRRTGRGDIRVETIH
jgi:hypothetical protein